MPQKAPIRGWLRACWLWLVDILSNGALMERFDWDGSKRETALHMFQLIQGRYRWDFPIALCPLMVPKGMSQDGAGMKTPADLIMESWAFKSVKYPYLLPFPRDIPIPGDEGLS